MIFIFLQRSPVFNQRWPSCSQIYRSYCKKLNIEKDSLIDPKVLYPMSEQVKVPATVTDVYKLSKSVRGLKLQVQDHRFNFKAGQWVDFFVSGLDKIAGYSMCTSPEYYKETNLIELAVKFSTYPPTKWVHDECKVGDVVDVALGGQFFFDYHSSIRSKDFKSEILNAKCNLLLIAGGVGINPLISIFRHVARNSDDSKNKEDKVQVLLLYCASSEDEHIFKDKICELVSKHENLNCEFLVTTTEFVEEHITNIAPRTNITTSQRLNQASIRKRISTHFGDVDGLTCYLCGPNEMIDDLSRDLYDIGVHKDRVKFEKWW